MCKVLLPTEIRLTVVDGTGFDSWQRSRHYEKRINVPPMPYAKADLFIDVKTRKILDFSLVCRRQHDVIAAEQMFKRFKLKELIILADRGYDSEPLHEVVRQRRGILYAPVRKMSKKALRNKRPKGKYRRQCIDLPEIIGQRSIIESVNSSLKTKQVQSLRAKKEFMKKREFGWHVVWYNLRMTLKSSIQKGPNFFIFQIIIYAFPDNA